MTVLTAMDVDEACELSVRYDGEVEGVWTVDEITDFPVCCAVEAGVLEVYYCNSSRIDIAEILQLKTLGKIESRVDRLNLYGGTCQVWDGSAVTEASPRVGSHFLLHGIQANN